MADPLRCTRERTTVRRTALTRLNNEYCENGAKHLSDEATSGGEHDHAARLLEHTTTGAVDSTATAPPSDDP
ncbi:hypothetical protein [Streptomyces sp. NPDC017958]|uniref:hypothetical protein n=1 Tax=Streptomyces sp. NPDC017958 TaxID=3365021 RepID=UPI0037B095FD